MARQKNQVMRFNDDELKLMKVLFAENEDLVYTVRKFLYQFKLNKVEQEAFDKQIRGSEPAMALMNKIFLPTLDADAPIFQVTDLVMGLNADIKANATDEEMFVKISAKDLEIKYLEERMTVMAGGKEPKGAIKLEDLGDIRNKSMAEMQQVYINVMARNFLYSYVDSLVQQVLFLAGKKEETVDETKARLAKNSAK